MSTRPDDLNTQPYASKSDKVPLPKACQQLISDLRQKKPDEWSEHLHTLDMKLISMLGGNNLVDFLKALQHQERQDFLRSISGAILKAIVTTRDELLSLLNEIELDNYEFLNDKIAHRLFYTPGGYSSFLEGFRGNHSTLLTTLSFNTNLYQFGDAKVVAKYAKPGVYDKFIIRESQKNFCNRVVSQQTSDYVKKNWKVLLDTMLPENKLEYLRVLMSKGVIKEPEYLPSIGSEQQTAYTRQEIACIQAMQTVSELNDAQFKAFINTIPVNNLPVILRFCINAESRNILNELDEDKRLYCFSRLRRSDVEKLAMAFGIENTRATLNSYHQICIGLTPLMDNLNRYESLVKMFDFFHWAGTRNLAVVNHANTSPMDRAQEESGHSYSNQGRARQSNGLGEAGFVCLPCLLVGGIAFLLIGFIGTLIALAIKRFYLNPVYEQLDATGFTDNMGLLPEEMLDWYNNELSGYRDTLVSKSTNRYSFLTEQPNPDSISNDDRSLASSSSPDRHPSHILAFS